MKNLYMMDCFGVLVGELAPVWFAKRFEPRKAREMKDFYFGGADRGEKDIKTLIRDISVGLGIDKDVIVQELSEIFNVNQELFDYLKVLKKRGNDVILVSNAPEGLVESIFDAYDFRKYFDNVFVSWKYKTAKPDLDYYRLCLSLNGGNYDKIFMIDDNEANLKGLAEIGVIPVLFRGNEALFKRLEEER